MRLLRGYRNVPPADRQALELMLVKVAQLAADLPEVRELDLNPVLLSAKLGIPVTGRNLAEMCREAVSASGHLTESRRFAQFFRYKFL